MAVIVRGSGGGVSKIPTGISVTTAPTKTSYKAGETLDLTGMVVTATYSDNTTENITSACTVSPSAGTVLYESTSQIKITWSWKNTVTYTTTQAITVKRVLSSIAFTSQPTLRSYSQGDTLNMSGAVVTATFTSGATQAVTPTYSPANGSTLSTTGTITVTASYTENGVTKTATTTVTVSIKTVTWAGGTDAEIAAMVAAADAGDIDLGDYWAVGDERTVSLSAMSATGVGESHAAQTVTMVLMNKGGKTLASATASGQTECNFIVGLKNGLSEYGYMNSSDTNSGGWDSCARRTWCNNVFSAAIPSALQPIFKSFKNVTAAGSSTTTTTSTDKFALPAEKEVFRSVTYANSTAESSLTQFEYYKTSANRIKKKGDSGSADYWWERSPYSSTSGYFCSVHSNGSAYFNVASYAYLVAPFGCI